MDLVDSIEENSTDKDLQIAINKAITNIRLIEKEIQTDLQVISIYTQAEYEKQLTEENIEIDKFELSKEKARDLNGTNEEVNEEDVKNIVKKIQGLKGVNDEGSE